jgi:hypothetical protein
MWRIDAVFQSFELRKVLDALLVCNLCLYQSTNKYSCPLKIVAPLVRSLTMTRLIYSHKSFELDKNDLR